MSPSAPFEHSAEEVWSFCRVHLTDDRREVERHQCELGVIHRAHRQSASDRLSLGTLWIAQLPAGAVWADMVGPLKETISLTLRVARHARSLRDGDSAIRILAPTAENVTVHLPIKDRKRIDSKLAGIFADPDPEAGLRRAKLLATDLAKTNPDAAGSLSEGLTYMFTVRRLGIDGTLARTLTTTKMIESMFSIVDTTTRNVKRWRNEGGMRRRWAAAGMLEAETRFRRVKGYRQLGQLKTALARQTATTVTDACDTDHNELAA